MTSLTLDGNPVIYPPRLCKHCGCKAESGNFHSFSSQLKTHKGWPCISAINTMFVRCSEQERVSNTTCGLCTKCWTSLATLFTSYSAFQERRNKDSGSSELMRTLNHGNNDIVTNDCTTNDSSKNPRSKVPTLSISIGVQTLSESNAKLKAIRNPPKTQAPILKDYSKISLKNVLRKKIKNVKGRRALYCFIKHRVRMEMRSFCKGTMLRDQVAPTDDVQFWKKLYEELKCTAPIILTVLHTIAGKQLSVSDAAGCLDPAVGAAFCVLAKSRSQHMSRFQKMVGLILCSTLANKDTFQFLHEVGVSMSYTVAWKNTRELVQPEADDNLKDMTQLEDRRFPQALSVDRECSDLESDSDLENNSGSGSESEDAASITESNRRHSSWPAACYSGISNIEGTSQMEFTEVESIPAEEYRGIT